MTGIEAQDASRSSSVSTLAKDNHAVALDPSRKRLLDSALPNDETKLRALITKLKDSFAAV